MITLLPIWAGILFLTIVRIIEEKDYEVRRKGPGTHQIISALRCKLLGNTKELLCYGILLSQKSSCSNHRER